jgi:hypothetical protein
VKAAVSKTPTSTATTGAIRATSRSGKLEQPLIVGSNVSISVIAVLARQLTIAEKRELCLNVYKAGHTNPAKVMDLQRETLVQRLRGIAAQTQAPLLSYLNGLPTKTARHVHPLWIANMIGLQATAPVINNLASFNEVEYIHLDLSQDVLQAQPESPWNTRQISAEDLPSAVRGQPVVVAVLDSGVDFKHPDLACKMWINPAKTEKIKAGRSKRTKHVYLDSDGLLDGVFGAGYSAKAGHPMDPEGHGTEVAGIIAGDGARGIRTGIAPTAQIMALRRRDDADASTEQQCFAGLQYAFANNAPILNFSSGWKDVDQPDYATWRRVIENVSDQMLVVTVAGNNGNVNEVPFNITIPGRVPLALSVGSSTRHDFVDVNSCRGPVTWSTIPTFADYPYPPGLMKPDLIAPGVGVCTLQVSRLKGNYTNANGTSMAAPHVAGVAALLLAHNPTLTPYAIRFVLEETAKKITGYRHPDPDAGWGRVQADRALAYELDTTSFDLEINRIRTDKRPRPNKPVLVYARWKNLGGQVLGNSEVRFYFADARKRTASDLDPDNDGTPEAMRFSYIGSYFVPIIGPKGSKHDSAEAVVRWTPPGSIRNRWWLGAWIIPGPASPPEANPHNNGAVIEIP